MKKHFLIAALSLMASNGYAQQPITIINQDYELARRTAVQQHKLVLVDFYTTRCVPCKVLDKAVFHNDTLANNIGKDFVVLKYNAEDDTVYNLSLKHHVSSYPTTIILTADGRVVNKMYGIGSRESLIEAYAAMLQESISLHRQGRYITGVSPVVDARIYPDFYRKYVHRIADIKPGDIPAFWAAARDYESELSFDILAYFGRAPQHVNDYFLQHKPAFEHRYGQKDVRFVINNLASEQFSEAVKKKDEALYEKAVKFVQDQLPPADAAAYIDAYSLDMKLALKHWKEAMAIALDRIRKKTMNEQSINGFCWTVWEICDDRKTLEQAAGFMKVVVEAHPRYATLDTYARLLLKQGKREAAIKAMKQAIAQGKADGEDTKESEEALSKF